MAVWLRDKPLDTDQVATGEWTNEQKRARTEAKDMSCSTPASNGLCSVRAPHRSWNPLPQNQQTARQGRRVEGGASGVPGLDFCLGWYGGPTPSQGDSPRPSQASSC